MAVCPSGYHHPSHISYHAFACCRLVDYITSSVRNGLVWFQYKSNHIVCTVKCNANEVSVGRPGLSPRTILVNCEHAVINNPHQNLE